VVGETTAQAQDLMNQLKDQVGQQAHGQAQRLAVNVRQLASELRTMSENGKPDSPATSVVRQIADQGHTVADRLERRGPGGLVSDLQDFARRRPGLFLAGAALAGFAASRLTKGVSAAGDGGPSHTAGSGAEEYRLHRTDQGPGPQSTPELPDVPNVPDTSPRDPQGYPPAPATGPAPATDPLAPAPPRANDPLAPPPPAHPPQYPPTTGGPRPPHEGV
jgi:hypothetical protein